LRKIGVKLGFLKLKITSVHCISERKGVIGETL
jgi:hypothetical protein